MNMHPLSGAQQQWHSWELGAQLLYSGHFWNPRPPEAPVCSAARGSQSPKLYPEPVHSAPHDSTRASNKWFPA